ARSWSPSTPTTCAPTVGLSFSVAITLTVVLLHVPPLLEEHYYLCRTAFSPGGGPGVALADQLPEPELLDLARRGAGELPDLADGLRPFLPGQARGGQVVPHLAQRRRRHPLPHAHHGGGVLTQPLVGLGHHR